MRPATIALLLLASAEAFMPSNVLSRQPAFVKERFIAPSNSALNMGIKKMMFGKASVPSKEEVRNLFLIWNNALATGESKLVAARYAKDAVLLPTVSDLPRTDPDLIKDYFDAFLLKEPQGKILEGKIRAGEGWAQDAGIYEFKFGATGETVKARYSFIYVYEEGSWKIAHHHSSVMPEGISLGKEISEDQVRNLFYLWNDALGTLDSETVANRYSKNAVLLPTVSDTPRTDKELIKDYFDAFLLKKPQGTILESNVLIGTNWCQDAGIYEFTMGSDNSKVQARYSFVYVWEDGMWKISHHHSSVMPEAVVAGQAEISVPEVQELFNKWNDALATLDPEEVADCYAKNAVLLPTVSDVPRTDYELIKDYFVNFLQRKPQGVILESNVEIGYNWAQDAGIYEFTMGEDGTVVKARYSFVYVFEDGEWKISHHHSSAMPEAMLASKAPVEEEVAV